MLKDEEMSQNDAFEQIRGLLWDGRIWPCTSIAAAYLTEPNPAARNCAVTCTKFVLVYFFEFWLPDESVLALTPSCHDFYNSKEEKNATSKTVVGSLAFDSMQIDISGYPKRSILLNYRLTKLTMHRGEVALGSNQADGSVNLPPHLAFPTPPCPQACIHPTQRLSQGLASHSIAT